jgi:hypothetical protein
MSIKLLDFEVCVYPSIARIHAAGIPKVQHKVVQLPVLTQDTLTSGNKMALSLFSFSLPVLDW